MQQCGTLHHGHCQQSTCAEASTGFEATIHGRAEMQRFAGSGRKHFIVRSQVALDMLAEAAQMPNIALHFSTSPSAIDFTNKTVEIETIGAASKAAALADDSYHFLKSIKPMLASKARGKEKTRQPYEFDLLIGADGAASQVRISVLHLLGLRAVLQPGDGLPSRRFLW